MTESTPASGADVTAVVCCFTEDRWGDVLDAVDGLDAQTEPPAAVLIVVDYNETLKQRLLAEYAGRADLSVVHNTGPQGLSGARNTAIAAASTSYVAFLDDDAVPDKRWLEELLVPFVRSPEVAVTGGRSVPAWPPSGRPAWFPEEFDWVVGSSYRGMPTEATIVRNVHGCSMLFRRDVFTLVGGFADGVGRLGTLPLGCEETELCIRLKAARPEAEVWYVPESLVAHRVSDGRTKLRYFVRRCYAEGISKAQIGRLVGAQSATATEKSYVSGALLPAVLGSIGLRRGRPVNPRLGAAIVLGLAVTVVGYARGSLKRR